MDDKQTADDRHGAKLSEDGIVHDDSFTDFEEALTSFWRNKDDRTTRLIPLTPRFSAANYY